MATELTGRESARTLHVLDVDGCRAKKTLTRGTTVYGNTQEDAPPQACFVDAGEVSTRYSECHPNACACARVVCALPPSEKIAYYNRQSVPGEVFVALRVTRCTVFTF